MLYVGYIVHNHNHATPLVASTDKNKVIKYLKEIDTDRINKYIKAYNSIDFIDFTDND